MGSWQKHSESKLHITLVMVHIAMQVMGKNHVEGKGEMAEGRQIHANTATQV